MESLPVVISSNPESCYDSDESPNTYAACNVCLNFCNVLKLSHRRSKVHQEKLTMKLDSIRALVRANDIHTFNVRNEHWNTSAYTFCIFCDKKIKNNQSFEGFVVKALGYVTHIASPEHAKAVKVYLKFHEREENFDMFCLSKEVFDKFLSKMPKAKEKYLKKLELLGKKNVQTIREREKERRALVARTIKESEIHKQEAEERIGGIHSENCLRQPVNSLTKQDHEKQEENYSIPPWEIKKTQEIKEAPVIGPTIETLNKHVASLKSKQLPSDRLTSSLKFDKKYYTDWMPNFRGVWNKEKRKYSKSHYTQRH